MKTLTYLLLLGLLLPGCSSDTPPATPPSAAAEAPAAPAGPPDAESSTAATLSPAEQRVAGIRLGRLEERVLSGGLKVNGLLDAPPENTVIVSALLGGIVESSSLLQGARVRAGQVLATVRNPEFVQLQQDYLEKTSQLEFARAEYERQQELYRQEVAPLKNFQRARAEYQALQAQVAAQAARLRLVGLPVGGRIATAAPVRAPRAGYLKTAHASPGQSVTPTDVLFEIVDPGHLDVVLTVFEKDAPQVRTGQRVRYTLANDSAGTEHQASVYQVGRTIGPDRTVRVYAHLRREDASRLPGTYVRAVIETSSATVPALPDQALVQFGGRPYVFAADAQPDARGHLTYHMLAVETGVSENGYTQVTLPPDAPAHAAQRLVVGGAYALLSALKNAGEE